MGRIAKFTTIEHICPSQVLNPQEQLQFIFKELNKISVEKPFCIALDENGENLSSMQFSKVLQNAETQSEKCIVFCIGGAYGLPKEIQPICRMKLVSLSGMTFAHELALVVLLEQLYRARCILANHPYHHGEKSPLALNFCK